MKMNHLWGIVTLLLVVSCTPSHQNRFQLDIQISEAPSGEFVFLAYPVNREGTWYVQTDSARLVDGKIRFEGDISGGVFLIVTDYNAAVTVRFKARLQLLQAWYRYLFKINTFTCSWKKSHSIVGESLAVSMIFPNRGYSETVSVVDILTSIRVMNIRQIIGLLIVFFLVRSGAAQEPPYDYAIGEAISRSDWFETRARYERTADSLSDYIRLFSGALLDHYFNNPAGAVGKIQHMYDENNVQMGSNFFSLFWMMSDNLAKLGHFKTAHDICTSLLAQGRDYMDEGTRIAFETNAVLFRLKSMWPRMEISDATANYDIPFDINNEQLKFTAVCGKQRIGVMLDSGGQMTIIDKQLALDLELSISADSIQFNETRCPLALLDILRLGTAVFVHVPCVV